MSQEFCPFKSYRYEDQLIYCNDSCALCIDGKCAFVRQVQQSSSLKEELEHLKNEIKKLNHE